MEHCQTAAKTEQGAALVQNDLGNSDIRNENVKRDGMAFKILCLLFNYPSVIV